MSALGFKVRLDPSIVDSLAVHNGFLRFTQMWFCTFICVCSIPITFFNILVSHSLFHIFFSMTFLDLPFTWMVSTTFEYLVPQIFVPYYWYTLSVLQICFHSDLLHSHFSTKFPPSLNFFVQEIFILHFLFCICVLQWPFCTYICLQGTQHLWIFYYTNFVLHSLFHIFVPHFCSVLFVPHFCSTLFVPYFVPQWPFCTYICVHSIPATFCYAFLFNTLCSTVLFPSDIVTLTF